MDGETQNPVCTVLITTSVGNFRETSDLPNKQQGKPINTHIDTKKKSPLGELIVKLTKTRG